MKNEEIIRILKIMTKDAITFGFMLNPHTLNTAL